MAEARAPYPANLSIDYPDRDLRKLTSAFRLFTAIPIVAVVVLLQGLSWPRGPKPGEPPVITIATAGAVVLPLVLMILFRQKYPRWWFDWNLALTKFGYRVSAYIALLRDEYPSSDEEQAVHVELAYPDVKGGLNRWLPLVKWLLAFPHYIVLAFLGIAAVVCVIIAWFAVLFTARYPRSLFDFVVGVHRWGLRVGAYAFFLVTDRYPLFALSD